MLGSFGVKGLRIPLSMGSVVLFSACGFGFSFGLGAWGSSAGSRLLLLPVLMSTGLAMKGSRWEGKQEDP